MKLLNRFRNRAAAFTHDLLMIPFAWLGAYWLRFNLETIPDPYLLTGLLILPIVMLMQGVIFWYTGLYRGIWRFASMPDLIRIIKAVFLGVVVIAVVVYLLTQMENVPRSVFAIHSLLLVAFLGGPRFLYRWLRDHTLYYHPGKKMLVVGAGYSGEMLVRDLLREPDRLYQPIAFVDDDLKKKGQDIHGVRVMGSCEQIPALASKLAIDIILIAIPSATSKQMRRIVGFCEASNVQFRTLPRFRDLVSGLSAVKELREVSIEDLLGREQVTLDWKSINAFISGKTVMVSGGGGSIGSELCRQIAARQPARVIVVDNSEFNLYNIDKEIHEKYPGLSFISCLGDVSDQITIDNVINNYRPQIVFHAAAYKHVPILEFQVREAVKNNVLGTSNIVNAASECNVDVFVLISTDKAVNPANIMGMSKRVAEIICQNKGVHSQTKFMMVRFGNVLNSTGSVVPLFRKQIEEGGPVTVTHPDITRYFMTIPEATQLILQASVIGNGSEIFVLDMGEPIKIAYLAEQLIILSGKKPGEDIEIVYTGLRPGEKIYEELFHNDEKLNDTGYPKILQAQSRPIDTKFVENTLASIERACSNQNESALRDYLYQLVPERSNIDSDKNPVRKDKSATI